MEAVKVGDGDVANAATDSLYIGSMRVNNNSAVNSEK